MTVVVMTDCPPKLRGDLTKWLLEINTGVYVGNISARVREELWARICENLKTGRATMVFRAGNEQRMDFWVHNTIWEPVDYEGLKLIRRPLPSSTASRAKDTLAHNFSNAAKRQIAHKTAVKRQNRVENNYVVVDIETTGLDADRDTIIEIAALRVDNNTVVAEFQSLVYCENPLPRHITDLTGLTDRQLYEEGVPLSEAMQNLLNFIGGSIIVCHNSVFDQKFLLAACRQCGFQPMRNRFFDTLALARRKVRAIADYKLLTLAQHFSLEIVSPHQALHDCYLTYYLYLKLKELHPTDAKNPS